MQHMFNSGFHKFLLTLFCDKIIIAAIFTDLPHHGGHRDVTPELSSLEEEDLSPGKHWISFFTDITFECPRLYSTHL